MPLLAPGTYLVAASPRRLQDRADSRRAPAGVGQEHAQHRARGRAPSTSRSTSPPIARRCVAGDSAVGEVIDRETIASLPVLERDALQFAQQAPGVAPPAPGSRLSTQGNVGLNVAGAREAVQQLPARRRRQQRPVPQPARGQPEPRRDRGGLAAPEHLRRRVRPQRRRARSTSSCKSGTSDLQGSAPTSTSATRRSTRATPAARRQPGAAARASTSSAARSAARSAAGRRSSSRTSRPSTPSRPTPGWRTCRPTAERAGDFSASGVTLVDPFTQQPFPGNVIPASRIDAAGAATAGAVPACPTAPTTPPTSCRRPKGGATPSRSTIKTDHHGWQDQPFHVRYTFSREDRDLPFPARARNLPGFGVVRARRGPQVLGVGCRRHVGPRRSTRLRFGLNALDRDNAAAERRHRPVRGARHHGAAARPPSTRGTRRSCVPGFETLGDDPNLPVRRQTRTLHLVRHARPRSRPAPRQGRRRAAALPVGRLQPPLRARPGRLHRRVHRPPGRRPAARLSDASRCSRANDNPQALRTWSANVFVQDDWRVSSRADRQRRPALRVQRAARGRRRPHGDLRPGDASSSLPGRRRTACRARASTRTATTSRRASA